MNLFKRKPVQNKTETDIAVAIMGEVPKVSMSEIVKAIHKDFNGIADVIDGMTKGLIEEANAIINNEQEKIDKLTDKMNGLKMLGFIGSSEYTEYEKSLKDLYAKREENKKKQELIKLIESYKFRYPNNKFVNKDMIESLCKKYNLWFVPAEDFKGTIPNKNLKEMINFKLKEEDIQLESFKDRFNDYVSVGFEETKRLTAIAHNNQGKSKEISVEVDARNGDGTIKVYTTVSIRNRRFICCPVSDINPSEVRNKYRSWNSAYYSPEDKAWNKAEVIDPVVLREVRGGYLIETAWGPEASDEIVVNQQNN